MSQDSLGHFERGVLPMHNFIQTLKTALKDENADYAQL
jgi:hypothetical protein